MRKLVPCPVCAHPKVEAINAQLARGLHEDIAAEAFGFTRKAVQIHKLELRHQLAPLPHIVREVVARTLPDVATELHEGCLTVFAIGQEAGKTAVMMSAIRERRELLKLEFIDWTKVQTMVREAVTQISAVAELQALPADVRKQRLTEVKHRILELEEAEKGKEGMQ